MRCAPNTPDALWRVGSGVVFCMSFVAASYFDVDGTLVKTNLVQPTLYYFLNQATPWKTARQLVRGLRRAPAMAMAELFDRRLFNEFLFQAYQGVSEDRLEVLSEEVYEKVLRPALQPFAFDLIREVKKEGHRVVFVSGELSYVLKHLARDLGADDVIANRLTMQEGVATGRLEQPVVAGPTKARLICAHAREHGYDLNACRAYSDSYSDVPMLSVVGSPTVVNPGIRLRLLARTYGWPIVERTR